MISFEEIFKTVAQKFAMHNVNNLGTKFLSAYSSNLSVIPFKFFVKFFKILQLFSIILTHRYLSRLAFHEARLMQKRKIIK